jgi:hypothetical protein
MIMKLLTRKTLAIWALVVSLIVPSLALADHQSYVLSSVPIEVTGQSKASNSGQFVTFAAGQTGTFYLRASLINTTDTACGNTIDWNHLKLVTNDNSASTTVTAKLFKLDLATGAATEVATITSSNSPGIHADTVDFDHTFDFCANAYYIRVSMTRAVGAVANVKAYAVQVF